MSDLPELIVDGEPVNAEMKTAGYQDRGAGAAIEGLKDGPKPISGADFEKAPK